MAWVNPYPTHGVLLPATPWVYPSKIAQKCPKRPRIEGYRANFNEFYKISHISFSFGPKNTFWACSKAHGYRYHNPYPYPAVPRPVTRAGVTGGCDMARIDPGDSLGEVTDSQTHR